MRHRVGFNRLGRKSAHRLSLHRNMATSLLRHERITTTKAKALAVRRTVEKMITRAKVDSVHNRRIIGKDIKDKEILAKLFMEIGPRFTKRAGGYTRILKIGQRKGDAAQMVIFELVEKKEEEKKASKSKKSKEKQEKDKASKDKVKAEIKAEKPKAQDVADTEESEPKKERKPKKESEAEAKDETVSETVNEKED